MVSSYTPPVPRSFLGPPATGVVRLSSCNRVSLLPKVFFSGPPSRATFNGRGRPVQVPSTQNRIARSVSPDGAVASGIRGADTSPARSPSTGPPVQSGIVTTARTQFVSTQTRTQAATATIATVSTQELYVAPKVQGLMVTNAALATGSTRERYVAASQVQGHSVSNTSLTTGSTQELWANAPQVQGHAVTSTSTVLADSHQERYRWQVEVEVPEVLVVRRKFVYEVDGGPSGPSQDARENAIREATAATRVAALQDWQALPHSSSVPGVGGRNLQINMEPQASPTAALQNTRRSMNTGWPSPSPRPWAAFTKV